MRPFSRRLLALCLCLIMLAGFVPAIDIAAPADAAMYTSYTTIATIKTQGGCNAMQGMDVDGTYIYCAKINSETETTCSIARVHKSTGAIVYLTNSATGTNYFSQLALPESYRSDMVSTVSAASDAKQGSFVNNQGFSSRMPAISFEGAFCINYFFTPNYVPENGITLYYWNASDYDAASVLTAGNASGSMKLEGSAAGEYRGDLTGIAAKRLSDAVYVAAVYENGGTTWTSGVLGYSIGAYCSSQAAKGGDVAALAMATAVYGYHAKQYFG